MGRTGDGVFRDAGGGREIARDKIAIVARRAHHHALRMQVRDALQVGPDRGHLLL